jgi:hypothetical protein
MSVASKASGGRLRSIARIILVPVLALVLHAGAAGQSEPGSADFLSAAAEVLPVEAKYEYHRRLKEGPVHLNQRDPEARRQANEIQIGGDGWRIIAPRSVDAILNEAIRDFQDYMQVSMQSPVAVERPVSLAGRQSWTKAIVVGRAGDLPECGPPLEAPLDYRIIVGPERVTVCGGGEIGLMQGLFNLEARLNLREGPFLPATLDTTRRSLYRTRMVLNYLGWMEWSDAYLSQVAHAGYNSIYASVYANPNGAEGTAHYTLVRKQDPAAIRDLVRRASRYGIGVYTPLLYRYTGSEENEEGLRELIRDVFRQTPGLKGFVLLTEGFFYDRWFGAGGEGAAGLDEWTEKWTQGVRLVMEECRRHDPEFEVLPWEYNIDFRPQRAELKRRVVSRLPAETIPLVTWENGKSFELGPLRGYIRDYSISVVGPAEVTEAQIAEAKQRGMQIYSKADTFASWQFGSNPYVPVPYQWHRRYEALEKYGIDGTLESWSFGYKPNFISDLRAWYCWSDSPALDTLLEGIARREFGAGNEQRVMAAWKLFSEAITLLPDTGPSMGTNFALGNPLFFAEPEPRTMTIEHSWWDQAKWRSHLAARIHPYWPFTRYAFSFIPDFSNRNNMAVTYAANSSGVARIEEPETLKRHPVLPLFLDRVRETEEKLEEGLRHYRAAAFQAPAAKRVNAFREVNLVEQMKRMLGSLMAILEFENLRFQVMNQNETSARKRMLDRMVELAREEKERTTAAIQSARWDSRIGFEMEMDYLYTPYVLEEKIKVLDQVLTVEIPEFRSKNGLE